MIKTIWALSAITAVGIGLLLPTPVLLGGGRHQPMIHVGAPR